MFYNYNNKHTLNYVAFLNKKKFINKCGISIATKKTADSKHMFSKIFRQFPKTKQIMGITKHQILISWVFEIHSNVKNWETQNTDV